MSYAQMHVQAETWRDVILLVSFRYIFIGDLSPPQDQHAAAYKVSEVSAVGIIQYKRQKLKVYNDV